MQINKTCDKLHNGGHYIYSVPQQYSLLGNDCDYAWEQPDGTVLGHGSILNHSSCEDGIRHVIRCLNPSNVRRYIFNVNITTPANTSANMYEVNTTTAPPDSAQSQTSAIIIVAIIIIIALGFALLIRRFIQQRSKKPQADVENHPLNTNTNSEEPRAARVNGSVNGGGVNPALPLQPSIDTDDES